jgi:hypothetical protein
MKMKKILDKEYDDDGSIAIIYYRYGNHIIRRDVINNFEEVIK